MEKHITATKAVREFSELLNTVRFKGNRYIIERNGKPIAVMAPIKETVKIRELKSLLNQLPKLDGDIETFADDVFEIAKHQPPLPEEKRWE